MPIPGVNVSFTDAAPASGNATATDKWFLVALAHEGAVGTAHEIHSLAGLEGALGERQSYSKLHDETETYLREGGLTEYVSRIVGPSAVPSSHAFTGAGSAAAITVKAKAPGAGGDDIKVAIVAGSGGKYLIEVTGAGVETSPELADNDEAVAWGATAQYVTVVKDGTAVPSAVTATSLSGGDDDRENITETELAKALTAFVRSLGVGQVTVSKSVVDIIADDTAVGETVLAHCAEYNRVAVLAGHGTVAEMKTDAEALNADGNASFGAYFGPDVPIPARVAGAPRIVNMAAAEAGVIARCDRVFGPGAAAAGDELPLRYVVGFPEFTDADRELLLRVGVNLPKFEGGLRQNYGYRSLSTDPNWVQFNYARLRMAITADLDDAARHFTFKSLDGKGHTLLKFKDALTGVLARYYTQDSLYGEIASEAFVVDVGPSVNTPETMAAGELHALVGVRFSPHAEVVYINVAKYPITQSL